MPDTNGHLQFEALGRLADIRVSNVDKKSVAGELPVQLCNYTDVYNADYLTASHSYMRATATHSEVQRFGVLPNDVVITKDSETPDDIGVAAVIDEAVPDLVCGYHLAMIRPGTGLNPVWLAKQFGHTRLQRHLSRVAAGTTRYGLSNGSIASLPIFIPPKEQQDIAATIFRTLDETIRKTEQLIAKLQQAKQGLLHDLLTRGIDDNGELRDPERHPEQFKDSVLGRIPKAWDIQEFGAVCKSSAFGPRFPSDRYDENGPLATLRTTDMDDEGNIDLNTLPRAAIQPTQLANHLLQFGDIVITRSGTCGVTGVFLGHEIPVVPGAFLIRFRLHDTRINEFYRRYFNSPLGRPRLERLAVGGVQKNVKGSDVLKLHVPVPYPEESIHISQLLNSVERDIEMNRDGLTKYQKLKSGLMDDLLTGRVRVPT
jgi:type I restriction enzyme S subunit